MTILKYALPHKDALQKGNPDMEELSSSFLEAAASSRDQSGDNKAVPGRFCSEMDCSRKHSGFASFVLESPAAEIAANVMDAAKCNFFYDILFVKEPNTVERTVWHQDAPYWAIEGEQVINALALLIFVQQTLPASTSSSPLQHADNENRCARSGFLSTAFRRTTVSSL